VTGRGKFAYFLHRNTVPAQPISINIIFPYGLQFQTRILPPAKRFWRFIHCFLYSLTLSYKWNRPSCNYCRISSFFFLSSTAR